MKRCAIALVVGVVLSCLATAAPLAAAAARTTPIDTCGQEVPSHVTGVLQNDLTCPTDSGYGVLLDRKAHLDLNGYTITGGYYGVFVNGARTTIIGPGSLSGSGLGAIVRPDNVGADVITIRDLRIGDGQFGILPGEQNKVRLELERVVIDGNAQQAIADCTGTKIDATSLTVTANGGGICGSSIVVRASTIAGNDGPGIFNWFGDVRLVDSTVTGNHGNVDVPGDVDIASYRKPKLKNSTCDHSRKLGKFPDLGDGSTTWQLCTAD